MPVIELLRPIGEGAIVELEGDFGGFAGLEEHLLETLELVLRTGHVGLTRSHVHLHGFGGVNVRGVLDHCADGCGAGTGLDGLHVAHFERGVAQAEAERVVDGLVVGVVVAVTHEHAFAIIDMPLFARPVDGARVVVDVERNGLRKLARWAHLAKQHVGERRTAGLSEQPRFEDALGVLGPWRYGDDGAVGEHDHNVLVFGCDGFEQCNLLGRHVEGLTVEAFGFGLFREP